MTHAAELSSTNTNRSAGHSKWLDYTARFGYASRGIVYLLVGGLALLAAFGMGGATTGSKGALQRLANEPLGAVALIIIAVGLLAYALWRFLQGALDADDHGKDPKALAIRAGHLVSSATHLILAAYAANIVIGAAQTSSSDGEGTRRITAWLMSQPFGIWLVGIAGAIVIAAGVAQVVKAFNAGFEKWLDVSDQTLRKLSPICRIGLVARGVTFWIIGAFLIIAAWQADPDEARGLGGALDALRQQTYGKWLLAAAGAGLIAFAAYSLIEAATRKINHTPHH